MRLKKIKKQCLFYSLRSPWLGLLFSLWNLTRLGSHEEPQQLGGVPLIGPPLKPVLCWMGPQTLVHAQDGGLTSGHEDLGKVTEPPGLLALRSPAEASFLRVQPPRHLSREWCPRLGWVWNGWWSIKGKKQWDTRHWVFAQAHSTLIHSRGSRLSLRLSAYRTRVGVKQCCCLVDITCNYNLNTDTSCHLGLTKPVGLLMTAALRKWPGVDIAGSTTKHNRLSKSQRQHIIFLTPFKEKKKLPQTATRQGVQHP